jgi:hypothetical protein
MIFLAQIPNLRNFSMLGYMLTHIACSTNAGIRTQLLQLVQIFCDSLALPIAHCTHTTLRVYDILSRIDRVRQIFVASYVPSKFAYAFIMRPTPAISRHYVYTKYVYKIGVVLVAA